MKHRPRIYFTGEQRAAIWDRWQRGESISSIGRLFERESSSIYPILQRSGGIRPPQRPAPAWPEPGGPGRDFSWDCQPAVYPVHCPSVEATALHD